MDGSTKSARGRFLLPRSRRLTTDLVELAKSVPHCAHSRPVDIAPLMEARRQLPDRISLAAIFIKAYGLMARQSPEFRQLFFKWPIANVYQHESTVLMLAIAREFRDEPWVFWGRFTAPETQSLRQIQEQLNKYQTGNVKRVFRQQYQLSAMPGLVRKAIWWWNQNISGRSRARRIGTAFLTTLASQATTIDSILSVQTGCMTYGPLTEDGKSRVTICYDHRLMDGATVAKSLSFLDEVLNGAILDEINAIAEDANSIAA